MIKLIASEGTFLVRIDAINLVQAKKPYTMVVIDGWGTAQVTEPSFDELEKILTRYHWKKNSGVVWVDPQLVDLTKEKP